MNIPLLHQRKFVGGRSARALLALALLPAFSSCKSKPSENKPLPRGVSAPVASGLPVDPAAISKIVNPKGEPAYSGPSVTVRGTVRVKGDPPPELPEILRQIPESCSEAKSMYGKLFREGPGRTLADVFVAVTGYEGYVPAQSDSVSVEASGCAWSTRTVGLTLGQRIDILVKDRRAYVPELRGGRLDVQLIAMPGTNGTLFPEAPGRYVLIDSMRIFAQADTLVVKYATFDVTGLDGKFEIPRVPVGKVQVNAILPAAFITSEKTLVLEQGKDATLDIELEFNEAAFRERRGTKAPAATPSAPAPSASGAHKD